MTTEPSPAVQAFWDAYVSATGVEAAFEPWWFGNDTDVAEQTQLGRLVIEGPKRATTSLLADYERDGEALPVVGGARCGGRRRGRAALYRADHQGRHRTVRRGERGRSRGSKAKGIRSLEYWREAHRGFFASEGTEIDDHSLVVLQRFDVVWPPPEGPDAR